MMMKFLLLVGLMLPLTAVCQNQGPAKEEIRSILDRQAQCWTNGDLDCFMEGYWKSDSLKFIGKSGLTYGWQQTLDNYKKNYNSREAMGTLRFDILEMDLLNAKTCFVIGKYHLTRTIGNLEGHFSLLWKKIDGDWVIVADHSS